MDVNAFGAAMSAFTIHHSKMAVSLPAVQVCALFALTPQFVALASVNGRPYPLTNFHRKLFLLFPTEQTNATWYLMVK